jgi:uncharacterized protein YndB with AHSA1/START domain
VTAAVYRCRDDVVVPAAREACFAVLRDVGTYARWWTLLRAEAVEGGTRLSPGVRFRLSGARTDGTVLAWTVRVTAVHAPGRMELAYDGGELVGTVGWELDPVESGTRIAYVYYGVQANGPAAEETFARWGTRFHSLAMREDALAGLVRLFGGPGSELADDAWRRDVRRRMAAGTAALG